MVIIYTILSAVVGMALIVIIDMLITKIRIYGGKLYGIRNYSFSDNWWTFTFY